MSDNVFSIDFFKQIALFKSDLNKDGEINEAEYEKDGRKINEKSIFDAEYKKFDMDKDGDVDAEDVELFKKSVGATPEGEVREAELEEFKKQHPNFEPSTATQEEVDEFMRLCRRTLNQREAKIHFKEDVRNTALYIIDMIKNSSGDIKEQWINTFDKFYLSIRETLGINNNDS